MSIINVHYKKDIPNRTGTIRFYSDGKRIDIDSIAITQKKLPGPGPVLTIERTVRVFGHQPRTGSDLTLRATNEDGQIAELKIPGLRRHSNLPPGTFYCDNFPWWQWITPEPIEKDPFDLLKKLL